MDQDFQWTLNHQCSKHKAHVIISFEWTTLYFSRWFYWWCSSSFTAGFVSQQYRTIQTIVGKYAEATTGFIINNDNYLALACSGSSTVLKHNGCEFVVQQSFQTHHSKSVGFVPVASVDLVSWYHLLALFYMLSHKFISAAICLIGSGFLSNEDRLPYISEIAAFLQSRPRTSATLSNQVRTFSCMQ